MSKTSQARVLIPEQFAHLLHVIKGHRYPEKNTALVQVSFKLGLRVQDRPSRQALRVENQTC